jgi:hypothetical protein
LPMSSDPQSPPPAAAPPSGEAAPKTTAKRKRKPDPGWRPLGTVRDSFAMWLDEDARLYQPSHRSPNT